MIVHLIFLDLSSRGLWRIGRQLQLEAAILKSFILMSESFFMLLMTIHVKGAATFNPGSPLPLSDAHPVLRMQPQTGERWSGAPESLVVPGAWFWGSPTSSPVSHCSELGHASGVTSTGPWVAFRLKKMYETNAEETPVMADPPLNPVSPAMYLGEIPWSLLYENGTFLWFPAIMCLFIIIFFWQFQ